VALPIASYALARIAHGGVTARYAIPMLIGLAAGSAYIASWLGRRAAALLLLLILAVFAMREARMLVQTAQLQPPKSGLTTQVLETAVARGVPLVIGGPLEYLSLAYYGHGHSPFLILVDPPSAKRYIGTSSLDLNLIYLRDFLPVDVQAYAEFSGRHPSFLLYAELRDPWDWWPDRLRDDGRTLQPLLVEPNHVLYLVE
jgi:hypothetical protein